jgi:hypothetical protein
MIDMEIANYSDAFRIVRCGYFGAGPSLTAVHHPKSGD